MNIKPTIFLAAVLAMALSSSVVAGGGLKMIQHEDAIEANSVQFFVDASGSGSVVVRSCANCEPVRLPVTSKTKAYDNGKEVPMASMAGKTRQTAVVFFLIKDKSVSRVTW